MSEKDKVEEICLSDFNKMALLDMHGIMETRHEYKERYYSFFSANAKGKLIKNKTARQLLDDYESGVASPIILRDFTDSVRRVKDRIFEAERSVRMGMSKTY
jgi:hypothetical protein